MSGDAERIPFRDTPLETVFLDDRAVLVKREDLSIDDEAAPKLAKLRGVHRLLLRLKGEGIERVGVYDTRVSHAGWGVAYLCQKLGLECHSYFPQLNDEHGKFRPQQIHTREVGGILHPLKGGRTRILYAHAKQDIEALGGEMLTLGLVCSETVLAHAEVARSLPKGAPIVISTGTGTIAAGVALGSTGEVFGVSAGMKPKLQLSRIRKLLEEVGTSEEEIEKILSRIHITADPRGYHEPETRDVPFPSSIWYDRKAWWWLVENLSQFKGSVVFYNIGDSEGGLALAKGSTTTGKTKIASISVDAYHRRTNPPAVTSQVDICPVPFHYDTYIGCPHGCLYCFARDNVGFKRRNLGLEFGDLDFNSPKALHRTINRILSDPKPPRTALEGFLKARIPLKIGANSDPFPEKEIESGVTKATLKVLERLDYPVQVQTKRPDVFLRYAEEFVDYSNLAISVTTVLPDDLAAKIEPNVPLTSERFAAMKELAALGFPVMAKMQPAIWPIIMEALPWLVESAAKAGCWAINTEGLKARIAASFAEKEHYREIGRIIGMEQGFYDFYRSEARSRSDYELGPEKKLAYSMLAAELAEKFGLKYYSADNEPECIKLGAGEECCGTSVLHDYRLFDRNVRTAAFRGVELDELRTDLDDLVLPNVRSGKTAEDMLLGDLVDRKVGKAK